MIILKIHKKLKSLKSLKNFENFENLKNLRIFRILTLVKIWNEPHPPIVLWSFCSFMCSLLTVKIFRILTADNMRNGPHPLTKFENSLSHIRRCVEWRQTHWVRSVRKVGVTSNTLRKSLCDVELCMPIFGGVCIPTSCGRITSLCDVELYAHIWRGLLLPNC